MSYVIKHADIPVLKFDIVENLADSVVNSYNRRYESCQGVLQEVRK